MPFSCSHTFIEGETGLFVHDIAANAVCPATVNNTRLPAGFKTHLSANRMSALGSRVFGVSIMSISTVVEPKGQGLSAKVTAVYLTVAHPALLFLEAN